MAWASERPISVLSTLRTSGRSDTDSMARIIAWPTTSARSGLRSCSAASRPIKVAM